VPGHREPLPGTQGQPSPLVPFYEDVIEAILLQDEEKQVIYVVWKRIAENLGLAWNGQYAVLREPELLAGHLINIDIFTDTLGTRSAIETSRENVTISWHISVTFLRDVSCRESLIRSA
jgi:hypothetical protein